MPYLSNKSDLYENTLAYNSTRLTAFEIFQLLYVDDRAGAGNAVVTGARFLNPGAGGGTVH